MLVDQSVGTPAVHVLSRVHLVETLFASGKEGLPVMFRCAGQIQAKTLPRGWGADLDATNKSVTHTCRQVGAIHRSLLPHWQPHPLRNLV